MSDTLIAYFSRADENYFGGAIRYVKKGNTEIVCEKIKELMDADTFRIEMKNPYSPVYLNCIEEAKKDLMENARPKLVSMPESIAKYDNIILAYPNYWGQFPWRLLRFLTYMIFRGKQFFRYAPMKEVEWEKAKVILKNMLPMRY